MQPYLPPHPLLHTVTNATTHCINHQPQISCTPNFFFSPAPTIIIYIYIYTRVVQTPPCRSDPTRMLSKFIAAVVCAGSTAIVLGATPPYSVIEYGLIFLAFLSLLFISNALPFVSVEILNFGSRVVTGFPPARALFFGSVSMHGPVVGYKKLLLSESHTCSVCGSSRIILYNLLVFLLS